MSVSSPQGLLNRNDASPAILLGDEARLAQQEMALAGRAANLLDQTYPGHLWTAEVTGGVLVIRNLALTGDWGFVLHPHKHLDLDHSIRYSGGELLERFNIARDRAGVGQAKEYLHERMKTVKQVVPSSAR